MSAIGDAIGDVVGGVGDAIGGVVGGITGANQAADAAEQAAQTQAQSAQAGINEQARQFDALVQLMSPYVKAGTGSLGQQQALLGLAGADKQQAAINALQGSPQFQAMLQQGENAMLQNASATGGLRGGNLQAAMAQFRPNLLNNLIQQQFQNLGGLTQIGQASAAGQASAGMQSAGQIANLLGQQGAAIAGGQMAQGAATQNAFNSLLGIGGFAIGGKKAGLF